MKFCAFEPVKEKLAEQYSNAKYIESSGLSREELAEKRIALQKELSALGEPLSVIKAKTLDMLLSEGRLALDCECIFLDKVDARGIMRDQAGEWISLFYDGEGAINKELNDIGNECGLCNAWHDFGHTSVNTELLFSLGLDALRDKIRVAKESKPTLTESQTAYYESADITLGAISKFIERLAALAKVNGHVAYECLSDIAHKKPTNIYEVCQFIIIHYYIHEIIAGTRVRTLGRLDRILYPYYKADIAEGRFTKDEIREILKYFLYKLFAIDEEYGLPFQIGGDSPDGEITNELSYLIVEVYTEIDIHSPKIHVRVSDKTPVDFIKLVLRSVRMGRSSFVFGNDKVVTKALQRVGASEHDARDYVFIGCYEPAVYAHEVGCTGNGHVNGAKILELVINRGRDLKSGKMIGVDTGEIKSYGELVSAFKDQLRYAVSNCIGAISRVERRYPDIYADTILSSMLEECIEAGADAYSGAARYNNSSLYLYGIATVVDSLAAAKRLAFDEGGIGWDRLCEILKNDWQGEERLRLKALRLPEKYGNNEPLANSITADISHFFASLVNGVPNGRGGVFKASNFTINRYVSMGKLTMATPDGRHAGDFISKNLSPTNGMDKKGITAVIDSVCSMDFTEYANGSVLDVMLHPSAVAGDDGIDAFYGLLKAFFDKGGIALHGNVFDAETLKAAVENPEKYKNLQVRVCGWNAYFVNLSKEEQADFIAKAENL